MEALGTVSRGGRLVGDAPSRRRWLIAGAALLAALLAIGFALPALTGSTRPVPPAGAPHTRQLALAALPAASQPVVSKTIGAGEPIYRVQRTGGTLVARNRVQGLVARFAASGVAVSAQGTSLGLSLRSLDWGRQAEAVTTASLHARANTVTLVHRGVTEQYANGPLGLEQSFTVARPRAGTGGALALELRLSSNRSAQLAEGGHGLVFAGRNGTALRYSGLASTDASGRPLASRLTLSGGLLTIHVDTRGARFPVVVDPFVQQGPKLTGGEESGAGKLGESAALSADGNTAIVGGGGDKGGIGAAWVFTRSEGVWTQQGPKLTATGESGAGRFGFSASLSNDGNTALIGAPDDSGDSGAVFVFTRSGSTWSQIAKLVGGAEEGISAEFGIAVQLSGDGSTALIGASADKEGIGTAWVFTNGESGWTQQGPKLTGAGEIGAGRFGFSVALSEDGNTALIGGGNDKEGVGAAWAFTRSEGVWTQQGGKLTATGESGAGHFGFSVALSASGNNALVGAVADSLENGAAFAFARSGGVWAQQGTKLTGAGESGSGLFGFKVALSADGESALIAGPGDASHAGAVWPFSRSGSTWTQSPKLTGAEESGKSELGTALALSGNADTGLAGGRGDNVGVGAAWVFFNAPVLPTVVTQAATVVTASGATLNGTVNPNGQKVTDCHFNYGTTTEYGSTMPCSALPGSGSSPVAVSAAITGLQPGTTYHFQLVATNSAGTGEGADQELTTGSPPEFGRCVKAAKGTRGGYSNGSCTLAATPTKFAFEWLAGPGPKTHFTATILTASTVTLETVGAHAVKCTGASAAGDYTGRHTVGGVVIKLTGCELAGAKCTSAEAAEGEVATVALEGQLGIEKKSLEGPLKNKIALDLFPPGATGPVAEFLCGPTSVLVEGSVLVPLVSDKMLTLDKLKFGEAKGKQKPESFEGQPKDVLSSSLAGGAFEQTGLALTLNRTNEEAVEINTVV